MIKERHIHVIEFTVIILLWTLAIVSPLLFMDDYSQNWRAVNVMWVECAVVGVAFLVNRLLLMPHLFFKSKYLKYFAALTLLLLILGIFIFYFDGVNDVLSLLGWGDFETITHPARGGHIIPPQGHPQEFHQGHMHPVMPAASLNSVIPPAVTVLLLSVIVIALDLGLSIAIKWVISEQKQAEIKRERVATQLSNLQSQVSPHFFMNTLNNIHALVEIEPKRAQQTIIELSGLMDYLLYESSSQETVSLKREIEFINSYVNLMRLRYPERIKIDFICGDNIPACKIPPLLFLNFIENTFKYGVDFELPSFIRITFSFSNGHIEMEAINTNHSARVKSSRHGLGISNARKRLKLLYGNKFSLEIGELEAIYCVNLKIPIK